jgi:hypothetical protein
MTPRGTLALWAAVAALGLYVWSTARRPAESGRGNVAATAANGDEQPLLRFHAGEVVGIEIVTPERTLLLQRRGTAWQYGDGATWTGAEPLGALIDTLGQLRPLRTIRPGPIALDDYGLDPPRQRVALQLADSAPLTLWLGERNPAGTGVYARSSHAAATEIVLIGAAVLWDVEKVLRTTDAKH